METKENRKDNKNTDNAHAHNKRNQQLFLRIIVVLSLLKTLIILASVSVAFTFSVAVVMLKCINYERFLFVELILLETINSMFAIRVGEEKATANAFNRTMYVGTGTANDSFYI